MSNGALMQRVAGERRGVQTPQLFGRLTSVPLERGPRCALHKCMQHNKARGGGGGHRLRGIGSAAWVFNRGAGCAHRAVAASEAERIFPGGFAHTVRAAGVAVRIDNLTAESGPKLAMADARERAAGT